MDIGFVISHGVVHARGKEETKRERRTDGVSENTNECTNVRGGGGDAGDEEGGKCRNVEQNESLEIRSPTISWGFVF